MMSRKAMLEDIAVLTGGQVISEDLGIKLENVTLDMLGRAKRVKVEKENTTIVDGAGTARLIPAVPGRDLAMVGITVDQEKLAGATEALAEAGLTIDDVPVLHAEPWDETCAGLLLDSALDATAIFSFSAMQAIAVAKEAQRRGLKVPGDLSVVGYNDIAEAATCSPPLTTLDTFPIEKGRLAAEMVLGNAPPQRRVLKPRLIIRGSTAQP